MTLDQPFLFPLTGYIVNEGACCMSLQRSLRHLAKSHGMVGDLQIATLFAEWEVHGSDHNTIITTIT